MFSFVSLTNSTSTFFPIFKWCVLFTLSKDKTGISAFTKQQNIFFLIVFFFVILLKRKKNFKNILLCHTGKVWEIKPQFFRKMFKAFMLFFLDVNQKHVWQNLYSRVYCICFLQMILLLEMMTKNLYKKNRKKICMWSEIKLFIFWG